MTEPFDAVLAEMNGESTLFLHEITDYHTRLAAAHAAEVAERDARIAELEADLEAMIDGNAYACQRAEAAERDARAKQARIDALMLEYCPEDMTPEQVAEWMGAIATTEQADE